MPHTNIALSPQHQTVDLKTHHIQHYHKKCLIYLISYRTRRIILLSENDRLICSVANINKGSKDLLRCFSPEQTESTQYNMKMNG